MSTNMNPGTRKLISALDALAIAEIVSANEPNLNGPLPPPFGAQRKVISISIHI